MTTVPAPARPRTGRMPGHDLSARWDLGAGTLVLGAAALLLLGTRQSFTVPFTGVGLPPAQLTLLVMAGLWVLTRVTGQSARVGSGALTVTVVVRLMLVVVSFGFGAGGLLSADQLTSTDRTVATEFVAAGTVVVLGTLLRRLRDIEFVLRALVLGGAVSGTAATLFYVSGFDLAARLHLPGLPETIPVQTPDLLREGLVRARGTSAAPLELGASMSILVPVAIGLVFAARRRGQGGWVWIGAAALMTAGAVVSLSRSVFIGIGIALVLMALGWPVRRTLRVLAGVAVATVAAVLSGLQIVRAVTTVLFEGSDDYSLGSRADGRAYVATHFTDHLWFGQGPGTYDLTRQPILDNQYLSQLMETGIVGLASFAVVLLVAVGLAARAARRLTGDERELALGVTGALVVVIVVSFVLDTAGFAQVYTVQWLMIGLAGALWRCASERTGRVDDTAVTGVTAGPAPDAVR